MKYVCPMHPEVQQENPGRCPKCGMALVPETKAAPGRHALPVSDRGLGGLTWKSYIPLIVVLALLAVSTAVLAWRDSAAGAFSLAQTIAYFMAGFFLVFAGFKLMDLHGFAEGYATYDLLGQHWFGYGYMYPFIELALGLAMLADFHSTSLLWMEVVVMAFSGIGVALKLARGEPFMCACLGTFLKVPLTYVTLIEDFGMALLAVVLIWLAKT